MASFYNTSSAYPNSGQPYASSNTGQPNFYNNNNSSSYSQQQPPQQAQQRQPQQSHRVPSSSSQHGNNNTNNSSSSNAASNPAMPMLFNPNTAGAAVALMSGNQDAILKYGQSFIGSVPGQVHPGVGRMMNMLRIYFTVDNRYVKRKIQRILFPYFFTSSVGWRRLELDPIAPPPNPDGSFAPSVVQYALPVTDENAPDLYIPSMSLVTYVLLCALLYGSTDKFTPEVLPDVTTKCIATQILEILIIRFGFYSMKASTPMLDLLAYTGYKYLGLCVNMLVGLLGFGRTGYYVGFGWTATSVSYFMLKVMSNSIPSETASTGPKRELMVVAFAMSQFATMWFLSQTQNLD